MYKVVRDVESRDLEGVLNSQREKGYRLVQTVPVLHQVSKMESKYKTRFTLIFESKNIELFMQDSGGFTESGRRPLNDDGSDVSEVRSR